MEKKELRKKYIRKRNVMEKGQVSICSERICSHIAGSGLFQRAERILVYYPLGNEADLRAVIEETWRLGKKTAFPRVHGDIMKFYEVTSFDQLEEGSFHVMEPAAGEEVLWKEALMLVPGVAFDRDGNRMGFGKGYYDKYQSLYPQLITVGISYELQLEEHLPVEPHDRRMDYMATEKGIWKTEK